MNKYKISVRRHRWHPFYLRDSPICGLGFWKCNESATFFDFHWNVDNASELAEVFLQKIFGDRFSGNINRVTSFWFTFITRIDCSLLVSILFLLKLLVQERDGTVPKSLLKWAKIIEKLEKQEWSHPSVFSVGSGDLDDELSSSIEVDVENGW